MNSSSNETSSRRTFSSPYLASVREAVARSQYRPSRQGTTARGRNGSNYNNVNSQFERQTPRPPPRGSRSAPPYYNSVHPEIHDYYQRRAELHKQVQKTFLKSKLDRLVAYQEQLAKEIDDLERGCGDAGIRSSKQQASSKQTSGPKLKQFRVLGGCLGNLTYKIHRKPDKNGKIRSFSIEVDVKGFMVDNIEIDAEEDTMIIKANKMNGTRKDLKIVAPSAKDMEKAYVHAPKLGLLVIDF